MKTYQSITSLATSAAVSSYSLYSNGFSVATPPTPRTRSINFNEITSATKFINNTQPSTPKRSSIVTLYDNELDIIQEHQQQQERQDNYENQIHIQINENNIFDNLEKQQYQNIIHINPDIQQQQQPIHNNISNNVTYISNNHVNFTTPNHNNNCKENFDDTAKTTTQTTATILNGIIQFSGNYNDTQASNVVNVVVDDNNVHNYNKAAGENNVDDDDDDDDDDCSVENTRL